MMNTFKCLKQLSLDHEKNSVDFYIFIFYIIPMSRKMYECNRRGTAEKVYGNPAQTFY